MSSEMLNAIKSVQVMKNNVGVVFDIENNFKEKVSSLKSVLNYQNLKRLTEVMVDTEEEEDMEVEVMVVDTEVEVMVVDTEIEVMVEDTEMEVDTEIEVMVEDTEMEVMVVDTEV